MLARRDLERVLRSLIADETGRARQRAVSPAELFGWPADVTIDEDGVGVDSVDKLAIVQRVSEFFHLHEVGSEDYLVLDNRLCAWIDVVAETLKMRHERITFRSSGSTGAQRPVTLETRRLSAELDAFDPVIGDVARVIAWTPPHHIFGYLFGALLPSRRDVETIDGRAKAPSFFQRAQERDLIAATPFLWRRLFDAAPKGGAGAVGVSSGAPCPDAVWAAAAAAPLADFIDVYGATETGGVGWRRAAAAPFTLSPIWSRRADATGEAALAPSDAPDTVILPEDRLVFDSDAQFRVLGRRDKAVQVAGVNVSLDATRAALLELSIVADAAVRQDATDPDGRLKAFIVLAEPLGEDEAAQKLAQLLRARLDAPARPTRFAFGAELPRNPGGKLADWAI